MDKTELKLIESYKELDIYLCDYFDSDKGVTDYISRMEYCHLNENPLYKDTYYKLKHVRWLRNSIMHDETNEPVKKEDIDFIISFLDDCKRRVDPLKTSYRSKRSDNENTSKSDPLIYIVILFIILFFVLIAGVN